LHATRGPKAPFDQSQRSQRDAAEQIHGETRHCETLSLEASGEKGTDGTAVRGIRAPRPDGGSGGNDPITVRFKERAGLRPARTGGFGSSHRLAGWVMGTATVGSPTAARQKSRTRSPSHVLA
jgi:hypothetical protein